MTSAALGPSSSPRTVGRSGSRGRLSGRSVHVVIVVLLTAVCAYGLPYYLAPMAQRVRHPLHAWLKPSGYLGQTAGILAFLLFLFMWLYPLRKRVRWLAFTGSVGRWLDVHIVCGLVLPILGAIHAGWRFNGLIGLGYGSMLLVSLSGIVGRYLYTRIPRGRSGLELSLDEIEIRRKETITRIAATTGRDPREVQAELDAVSAPRSRAGVVSTVLDLVAGDLARWRAIRALGRRWRDASHRRGRLDRKPLAEAVRLARKQVALGQQVRLLDATHRLFRLWHVAHRPIAITALLSIFIHVVVVVALGVTWLW